MVRILGIAGAGTLIGNFLLSVPFSGWPKGASSPIVFATVLIFTSVLGPLANRYARKDGMIWFGRYYLVVSVGTLLPFAAFGGFGLQIGIPLLIFYGFPTATIYLASIPERNTCA